MTRPMPRGDKQMKFKEMTPEDWEICRQAEKKYAQHVRLLSTPEVLAMVSIGLDYLAHRNGAEDAAEMGRRALKRMIRLRSH